MDRSENGKRIQKNDPFYKEVKRRIFECKANGVPYPKITVDDYYQYPFGWVGMIPYRLDGDHEQLDLTYAARCRPVALPDDFIIDGEKQLPTENKAQYAKYLAYRDLPPESRSSQRAARSLGIKTAANSFHALAARFRWEERAAAWDGAMQVEAERTQRQLQEKQMTDHLERRQTYLDNEHEAIVKGMTRIHEMLNLPIVEQRVVTERDAEGREVKITVWEPAKWTYASLSQFMGEIDRIARLHFGLSTSNASQKIDATISDNRPDHPAMSGADAEMHAYAAQKAEEAYFAAIEEWKRNHTGKAVPPLVARVEAA